MLSFKNFIEESYQGRINWSAPNADDEHHDMVKIKKYNDQSF